MTPGGFLSCMKDRPRNEVFISRVKFKERGLKTAISTGYSREGVEINELIINFNIFKWFGVRFIKILLKY